jgi:hypothetical protein
VSEAQRLKKLEDEIKMKKQMAADLMLNEHALLSKSHRPGQKRCHHDISSLRRSQYPFLDGHRPVKSPEEIHVERFLPHDVQKNYEIS